MTELLTSAQMRTIETAAMESGSVTGLELMECAGKGVVAAMFDEWPDLAKTSHRAVVLCGPGNNGGDGFVVARLLKEWGWEVEVFLYGDANKLPPDAKANCDRWQAMGEVAPLTVENAAAGARPTVLVDAMFGTGLTRAIPLECARAYHAIEARDVGDRHPWLVPYHIVAVDCPSGLDCDSGQFLLPKPEFDPDEEFDAHWKWWQEDASKRLLNPHLTATFHRRKVGHYLGDHSFKLRNVDIGLGQEDRHPAHLNLPRSTEFVCLLDFDPPKVTSRRAWPGHSLQKRSSGRANKFEYGHALILSGGPGKTGAARLAARGALRIGAGLVTLGTPPAAQMEVASQITALMLTRVADAEGLSAVLEDVRINALCLGPGLGLGDHAAALVDAALAEGQLSETRHVVFDADALTLIAQEPARMQALNDRCILTPHGGEFARLFPDLAEKLATVATKGPAYSKVDATRDAAKRAGCIVLFKGPDTVIAHPDGRASIHAAAYDRAAPWLATAGAGDVLAGFIAGLLARGHDPMQAAETAAWLHVECARSFGPGLVAEDLPEELPNVFRQLGL